MRLKQDLKMLWWFWKKIQEREGRAYTFAVFGYAPFTLQQQADIDDYLNGKKHMKRYSRRGK